MEQKQIETISTESRPRCRQNIARHRPNLQLAAPCAVETQPRWEAALRDSCSCLFDWRCSRGVAGFVIRGITWLHRLRPLVMQLSTLPVASLGSFRSGTIVKSQYLVIRKLTVQADLAVMGPTPVELGHCGAFDRQRQMWGGVDRFWAELSTTHGPASATLVPSSTGQIGPTSIWPGIGQIGTSVGHLPNLAQVVPDSTQHILGWTLTLGMAVVSWTRAKTGDGGD